jgi:Zn-dependent peptidase ImmA (M78 family)/plasmid maintenance system antidote protein VapI
MKPEQLAGQLDYEIETIRRLISGTCPIDEGIASAISRSLGGSPDFWLRRQSNYEQALDRAAAAIEEEDQSRLLERAPAPGPKPRGKMSPRQRAKEIRKRLAFYNVNGFRAWELRYAKCVAVTKFRTSGSFHSDPGAVSLWLRQGEIEANLIATESWNPHLVRQKLQQIRMLSLIRTPERFLKKLRELLAQVGIALVIVKPPARCTASGASRFLSSDKAMILMSLRHKSDDHFWFTLIHELGHLLLHGDQTFIDEDGMSGDNLEFEANEFAQSCIIPTDRRDQFESLSLTREAIIRFSISTGIAPGVIVGQLQKSGRIAYDRFNYLKRFYKWENIEQAMVSL